MPEIDTSNKFMVGIRGEEIWVAIPPRGPLTKADALNLAAYLVAIADTSNDFPAILQAIQNT